MIVVIIENYVTARLFSLIPTLLPGGEGLCIPRGGEVLFFPLPFGRGSEGEGKMSESLFSIV